MYKDIDCVESGIVKCKNQLLMLFEDIYNLGVFDRVNGK